MPKEKWKMVYDAEQFANFTSFLFKNIQTKEYHKFIIFADRYNTFRSINQIAELIAFVENRCGWLVGYNSADYDNMMLMYLIVNQQRLRVSTPRQITNEMAQLSYNIITAQREKRMATEIYGLRKYNQPFRTLDLILQYNTSERTSLKQIAIGLKWPILEDLPIKPGSIVLFEDIPKIEHYNKNDVDITEKLMHHLSEKINLRIEYSQKYGVDIINSCNSDIGKQIIAHYYEKETGIKYKNFKDLRTNYDKLALKDCVSPRILFETKEYQRVLEKVQATIYNPNLQEKKTKKIPKQFEQKVRSKYLTHTMALGGLHSNGPAEILTENDSHLYIDIDARSYYPWIIINDGLYPAHLGPAFTKVYRQYIVEERMRIVNDDPVLAYILKIAANAAYGLTKSRYSWLYDPKLTTYICVSGQLYLFMLVEALEKHSNCIVVYSNTDGLTVKVPRDETSLFYAICDRWMKYTNFQLEFVKYKRMIIRDVNNFIMFPYGKAPKAKGIYMYEKEEYKGYDYPIIAKAIQNHFNKGIPVEETVNNETSIYEFMAAEKTSQEKFDVYVRPRINPTIKRTFQKNNRWAVTHGNPDEGRLIKYHKEDEEEISMQKGHDVTVLNDVDESIPIEAYKIDKNYYITEAWGLIHQTKKLDRDSHLQDEYTQQELFA
jgi:hypothetical protein